MDTDASGTPAEYLEEWVIWVNLMSRRGLERCAHFSPRHNQKGHTPFPPWSIGYIHAVKEAWRSKAQLGRYHKGRLIKDGGSMKGWGVEVGWGGGHCWKTRHLTHDSGFIFCNLQLQADKKSRINVIPPHTHHGNSFSH